MATQLIPALAVLQAVRLALQPLVLVQDGAPWDGKAAFEKVGLYNVEQFEQALISLIETASDRVAIIVPVRLDNTTVREGRVLKRLRSLEFIVIVADAVIADSEASAAFSDADITTPSAWGLAEAVDMRLMGENLGLPRVALEAGDWEPLAVTNEAGVGRAALACTWRTSLGASSVELGRPRQRSAPGTYGANVPVLGTDSGSVLIPD